MAVTRSRFIIVPLRSLDSSDARKGTAFAMATLCAFRRRLGRRTRRALDVAVDDTLMIDSLPLARIAGIACLQPRHVPSALTACTKRQLSNDLIDIFETDHTCVVGENVKSSVAI